jgi:succinoglycan biosynthesis protein ExoA
MSGLPLVSIVVPCHNEAWFIVRSLESLCANSYPPERMEILVADGMSNDGTRDIVKKFAAEHGVVKIRLIDNAKRSVPAAMNVGIQNARGEIIVKADAHALYPVDYIEKCVHHLQNSDADNVGGIFVTVPADDSALSEAIALVLAHPLGAGNAPHFRPDTGGPRYADTAAFGCYRREVFDRIGLYNEEIIRSADMDINARLRRSGRKILLVPSIVIEYHPRPGFRGFVVRNYKVGFWVVYATKFGGRAIRWRHAAPLAALVVFAGIAAASVTHPMFRLAAVALMVAYAACVGAVSLQIAIALRKPVMAIYLPAVFATRHFFYAIGSLWGAANAVFSIRFWRTLLGEHQPGRPKSREALR